MWRISRVVEGISKKGWYHMVKYVGCHGALYL